MRERKGEAENEGSGRQYGASIGGRGKYGEGRIRMSIRIDENWREPGFEDCNRFVYFDVYSLLEILNRNEFGEGDINS